jgi:citrate lyase subunit beta/citryl-CoA lyase
MSLWAEDFATAIGAEPTEEALALRRQIVLHTARVAGLVPLGRLGTLAGFADPAAFHAMAVRSRGAGFKGASCINPAQVAPLNAALAPSHDEVAYARRVTAAAAEARTRAAAWWHWTDE